MNADSALSRVVEGGFCIGCGACAVRSNGGVAVEMNAIGMFQARLLRKGGAPTDFDEICPFSGASSDEDAIAADCFPDALSHSATGRHLACFAGHVLEDGYRAAGSSGGLTSWLLVQLLQSGAIDGVLHVRPSQGDMRFRYEVSADVAAIRAGAKSRYYPVHMSDVLERLRKMPGRYAVVGVPCFIKATRLLADADEAIAQKIAFRFAIVCGHLKSAAFADYLSMVCGVAAPDGTIDFRHKLNGRHSGDYAVAVSSPGNSPVIRRMAEVYGGNWGYGFFKYSACDFCDDVLGETADISIGDAWLKGYIDDGLGANVAVVRSPHLLALIDDACREGRLALKRVDAETVARSQEAGLRDRREGLSWRLAEKDAAGAWRPRKRVTPSRDIPRIRRRVYQLRQLISATSHQAFAESVMVGSLQPFMERLRPLTAAYDALYQPSLLARTRNLLRRTAGKIYRALTRSSHAR